MTKSESAHTIRIAVFAGLMASVASAACYTSTTRAAAMAATYRFTAIAYLNHAAPGGGTYTYDFEPSAVNDSGAVAFTADLSNDGGKTDIGEGVFTGLPGSLANPVRVGRPAPRGGTFAPGELGRIGFNQDGDAVVPFALNPFVTNPLGLNAGVYFAWHTGQLSALLSPGDHAPNGGRFRGTWFHTGMNNQGDAVFAGAFTDPDLDSGPPKYHNMGTGLFLARDGRLPVVPVVQPGDAAPGGREFDSAVNGSINDGGDIAFGGHLQGDECIPLSPMVCSESVYLRHADTGAIQSIAHQGQPSPCGSTPYRVAFGPLLNDAGDIAFIGDMTHPPGNLQKTGVFLSTQGATTPVACPGAAMPGGGHMVSAGSQDGTYAVNQGGEVSFSAVLDTSTDGSPDTGLYAYQARHMWLVARSGTVLPGIGTIAGLGLNPTGSPSPAVVQDGGPLNDRGQILFSATLTNGKVALLLASPETVSTATAVSAQRSSAQPADRRSPAAG